MHATAQQVRPCLLTATIRNEGEVYASCLFEGFAQNLRCGAEAEAEHELARISLRISDQFRDRTGWNAWRDDYHMGPGRRGRHGRQPLKGIKIEIGIKG